MPQALDAGGVGGDADGAGDDGEYNGKGTISGVVGGVMYTIEGFWRGPI